MELHIFFDKTVDSRYGGVILRDLKLYGANGDKINSMSIEERLCLLQEKARDGSSWGNWVSRYLKLPHGDIRYQDLPFLPDGFFYDCGLERISFGTKASSRTVATDDLIMGNAVQEAQEALVPESTTQG